MTSPRHSHTDLSDRLKRLHKARLYLICDLNPGGRGLEVFLPSVLEAGVDVVQLRDKQASDSELIEGSVSFRAACDRTGTLFILNDRPDLVPYCMADGAHIGQDDLPLKQARQLVGGNRIIGLSTHSPEQIDAAQTADYIGVGPVHSTPTKPGRPAVGLELVRYASSHSKIPFFAIGGIDLGNLPAVVSAGADRVAVVRAIGSAEEPEAAVRQLQRVLADRTQGE